MVETNSDAVNQNSPKKQSANEEVKWDYTTRESTLYTGLAVVGLNGLVILIYILYRTVPSVHSFLTGRPA